MALTTEGTNQRPRWTRDSKRIIFVSNRGGSSQIWAMKPDGSEQKAITTISHGSERRHRLPRRQVDRLQQRRLPGMRGRCLQQSEERSGEEQ